MILIIGGAYQGKLAYAKKAYRVGETDIFTCTGPEIDFSKRCVQRIEEFVYGCLRAGKDPKAYLEAHKGEWKDSIFICRDIFCGVVPMEPETREWRQETGRFCQYLTGEAERVHRMFCGLEQRLK